MKLSRRLEEERRHVERMCGASPICNDCSATLATFADACTADLDVPCQGYLAIERAKDDFKRGVGRGIFTDEIGGTCPTTK